MPQEIDRIIKKISYDEFVIKYLLENKPCLFSKWISSNWNSINNWVSDGEPNFSYLLDHFGEAIVPVISADSRNNGGCTNPNQNEIIFKDFLHLLQNQTNACPYLKDWHFNRCFTNYKAYEVPVYFQEDWLNEFWEDKSDDYKFVYIGPKNSWTAFHADVLRSYSWSANICGQKLWYLFQPGEELKIGDNVNDIRSLISPDSLSFNFMRVIQEEGEIIFVPSGWFHQVHNLENTISINHNWLNGYNINFSWKYLQQRFSQVEKQIIEYKDMPEFEAQCQLILQADTSFNYSSFFNFLHCISKKRIDKLNSYLVDGVENRCDERIPKDIHNSYFDLKKIWEIIDEMTLNKNMQIILSENPENFTVSPTQILTRIQQLLHQIEILII